jgi:hypothetical protein
LAISDCFETEKMKKKISGGLVHELPADLVNALTATKEVTCLWEDLTPIARNEFICWVEDAKKEETRTRRIKRTVEELLEGQKRPCCWVGCIHRTDKKPSKWQQDVLLDKKPRK